MSVNLDIDNDVIDNAKFVACKIDDTYLRKRAYALAIAANATAKYLNTNGLKTLSNHSLYRSAVFAKEVEIADIYANNARFDVRVTFNDKTFTVPKLQVKYDIKPQAYIVVKFDSSLKDIAFLGFIPTEDLTFDKNGEEYYTYSLDILKPIEDFIPYAQQLDLPPHPYNEEDHENVKALCLSFIDEEATEADKIYFIKHVADCPVCRETFCDMNDFDDIVSQLKNYHELLNDSTLSVLSGNKKEVDQAVIANMAFVENAGEDLPDEEAIKLESSLPSASDTLIAGEAASMLAEGVLAAGAVGAATELEKELEPEILNLYDEASDENEDEPIESETTNDNISQAEEDAIVPQDIQEDEEKVEEPALIEETGISDEEDLLLSGDDDDLSLEIAEDLPLSQEQEDESADVLEDEPEKQAESAEVAEVEPLLNEDVESVEDEEGIENGSFDELNASIEAFASEPVQELLSDEIENLSEAEPTVLEEDIEEVSVVDEADNLSENNLDDLNEDVINELSVGDSVDEIPADVDNIDALTSDDDLTMLEDAEPQGLHEDVSAVESLPQEDISLDLSDEVSDIQEQPEEVSLENIEETEEILEEVTDTVEEFAVPELIESDEELTLDGIDEQVDSIEVVKEPELDESLDVDAEALDGGEVDLIGSDDISLDEIHPIDEVEELEEISEPDEKGLPSEFSNQEELEKEESLSNDVLDIEDLETIDSLDIEEADEKNDADTEFIDVSETEEFEGIELTDDEQDEELSVPNTENDDLLMNNEVGEEQGIELVDDSEEDTVIANESYLQEEEQADYVLPSANDIPTSEGRDFDAVSVEETTQNAEEDELQGLLDDDLLALLSDDDEPQESQTEATVDSDAIQNANDEVELNGSETLNNEDDNTQPEEENGEIENLFDEQNIPQDGEHVELDLSQEPMSAEAVKKTKKLAIAGALITLLAIGGAAGGFYMYQKNIAANNDSIDTAQDNQVFDFQNKGSDEEVADTASAAVSQDINKSMTNSFSDKPAAISITKLSWQINEKLAVEPSVKEYLQTAGKNIQLNLQNDLANASDVAFNNSVKVSIEIAPDNTIKGIQVLESSGSDKIDAAITTSIKNTLKYVSVPKLKNYNSDYFLTLIINF